MAAATGADVVISYLARAVSPTAATTKDAAAAGVVATAAAEDNEGGGGDSLMVVVVVKVRLKVQTLEYSRKALSQTSRVTGQKM